jgi:tRNA threonylcarbamoyl adenosine modification protein YjeE
MSDRRLDVTLDREALEAWAEAVGRGAVDAGLVVALTGPLGAGKTTLVRAASRAAGALELARSPTYTLHHRHRLTGGGILHHLDLYRISTPAELGDLGWDELMDAGDAVFVEWADRASDALPPDRWDVELSLVEGGAARRLRARARGAAPPLPESPAPEAARC